MSPAAKVGRWSRAAALASLALAIVACGGGGSSTTVPNQPPVARFTITPDVGPPPLEVSFDASASSDSDGSIVRYDWDFGGGASASGRVVARTFDQSGTHTVRLTVTDDDGATAAASEELLVNANPVARIVADPTGGTAPLTVSFDAASSTDSDGTIESYAWNFGNGAEGEGAAPTQTFSEPGLYATRLTVTDNLGATSEVVFELNVRDPATPNIDYLVPYVADGSHAEDLDPCLVWRGGDFEYCKLERLPFLGMEVDDPTIDDVMSRVLVSHRWMGDNLRTALELLPADLRLLARSLTGIVVATNIRPAYYSPNLGAMYLDAEFFWRTAEQRAVISKEPDRRAAFQRKLKLRLPWRFVRNNQLAIQQDESGLATQMDENGVRVAEDFAINLGLLLYHELSHAGDFMHVSRLDDVDPSWTPGQAVIGGEAEKMHDWPSDTLLNQHPLRSELMRALAQVTFFGDEPTPAQAALLPQDIVAEFADDGAVDYYSYSTQFEDLAVLHSTTLVSYHFGYEADIAITDNPGDDDEPLIVAWGQRGRMTDPMVIDRTRFVLEAMYPGDVGELVDYVSNRPAPLSMRSGESWEDNLVLEGGDSFSSKAVPNATSPVATRRPALVAGPGLQRLVAALAANKPSAETQGIYLGCIRIE